MQVQILQRKKIPIIISYWGLGEGIFLCITILFSILTFSWGGYTCCIVFQLTGKKYHYLCVFPYTENNRFYFPSLDFSTLCSKCNLYIYYGCKGIHSRSIHTTLHIHTNIVAVFLKIQKKCNKKCQFLSRRPSPLNCTFFRFLSPYDTKYRSVLRIHIHTFVTIIRNTTQVQKMRADYSIPNCVTLPQLYFDTLAQWWKHFRKYNLLIPNRTVRIFLHRSFALKKKENK